MTAIIVLFNLKAGTSVERYEQWARDTDLATVRGLGTVEQFEVLRTTGLLSGAPGAPFQYVEILRVKSVAALKADIAASPVMAEVARQFREFAESPVFMVTEAI